MPSYTFVIGSSRRQHYRRAGSHASNTYVISPIRLHDLGMRASWLQTRCASDQTTSQSLRQVYTANRDGSFTAPNTAPGCGSPSVHKGTNFPYSLLGIDAFSLLCHCPVCGGFDGSLEIAALALLRRQRPREKAFVKRKFKGYTKMNMAKRLCN
ncbi:hypothetical protein HZ326_12568 [Fusarium oxysporum f. sp. albedinis]|nr:hypothetical protein HZ326_12568 [Fusarium oxysporum f. sp. albedinis]